MGLNEAFMEMRKRGLLALQNHMCCSGCAGHSLASKAEELIASGKREASSIKGAVFYHSQDNAQKVKGMPFHLSYGSLHTQKFGPVGIPAEEVGRIVCQCLTNAGITWEWSGLGSQRIRVVKW